jgi:predicted transcriptional regulator
MRKSVPIRQGIEQADRGELIDHEDVKARIFRRLQAK